MTFLYIIVALAIVFDFINGFHDSANSIATVVSTKVLSPLAAVLMAAFFNFIALQQKMLPDLHYGLFYPVRVLLLWEHYSADGE